MSFVSMLLRLGGHRAALLPTALALTIGASACGQPFDVKTAPGFVALENQAEHDWRATTPEGVVVAVRVADDSGRGDLGFWTQAISLQLRDVSGYALIETTDVTSADGTKGKLLKFGLDQENKPFVYWVALYLAQDRVFVVEAGGAKELFERARPNVEWTMKSVRVRCSGFLAPVLSSHTCNRW